MLYKHELDVDHRTHIYQNHFQDGDGAFQYLIGTMRTPIDRLQLRELDDKWAKVDILQDVGVQENTILLITTKIKAKNAKRPLANRKTQAGYLTRKAAPEVHRAYYDGRARGGGSDRT